VPIYEYQCGHCEHRIEAIQKISEAPLRDCPECKQDALRKLVSAAAFKLTGTGWYETDFKDKKPTIKEKKDKEDSKVASNKDGNKTGKSETKQSKSKTSENSESKPGSAKKKETTTTNSD